MFNARLSVEKRVRCVRLYSVTGNVAEVRRQILQEYGPPAPKRDTIARLNKQLDSTGSVLDAKKTGQEKSVVTPANQQAVALELQSSPEKSKSQRRLSAKLGIPRTSIQHVSSVVMY